MSEEEIERRLKMSGREIIENSPLSTEDAEEFHRVTAIREIDRVFDSGDTSLIEGMKAILPTILFPSTPKASKAISEHFYYRESQITPTPENRKYIIDSHTKNLARRLKEFCKTHGMYDIEYMIETIKPAYDASSLSDLGHNPKYRILEQTKTI